MHIPKTIPSLRPQNTTEKSRGDTSLNKTSSPHRLALMPRDLRPVIVARHPQLTMAASRTPCDAGWPRLAAPKLPSNPGGQYNGVTAAPSRHVVDVETPSDPAVRQRGSGPLRGGHQITGPLQATECGSNNEPQTPQKIFILKSQTF